MTITFLSFLPICVRNNILTKIDQKRMILKRMIFFSQFFPKTLICLISWSLDMHFSFREDWDLLVGMGLLSLNKEDFFFLEQISWIILQMGDECCIHPSFCSSVFFPLMKIFGFSPVKNRNSPWKTLKKCPWKSKCPRENLEQISTRETKICAREIFQKLCPWKV